ncbi:hypothetical protein EC957_004282, partial [Mortierella hygrophila]
MRFSALVGLVASVFLIGSAVGNPSPAPSDDAVQAEKWHKGGHGGGHGGHGHKRRSLEEEDVIDGDERALWGWGGGGGGGWQGGGWRGGGWRGGGWRGGGWRGG